MYLFLSFVFYLSVCFVFFYVKKDIEVPENLSGPIGIVCAVCTCTFPPADVIYSTSDGFFVLHPRVRALIIN
jgi:hypothetical protein